MREGGSCFFTESLLYNGELFYVLALKLFIYCYLVLSSFHAVVCVSHLLCFSFPFPCSPFGAFQFARHGDKISEKKEQNVRMEEKKQKKPHALFVVIMVVFVWGELLVCVFSLADFKSRRESCSIPSSPFSQCCSE